jgi:hypothetical protein
MPGSHPSFNSNMRKKTLPHITHSSIGLLL